MTAYIGHPLRYEASSGRTAKVELRVEPSEAYDGHLSLGTYGYNSGNEMGTVTLSRADAIELRAALNEWLGDEKESGE